MANATRISTPGVAAPQIGIFTYAGTTAAQTINIGFQPEFMIGVNWTDADKIWIWYSGDLTTVTTIDTEVATEAIVITKTEQGFALPASDTTVNENGKTFLLIAVR